MLSHRLTEKRAAFDDDAAAGQVSSTRDVQHWSSEKLTNFKELLSYCIGLRSINQHNRIPSPQHLANPSRPESSSEPQRLRIWGIGTFTTPSLRSGHRRRNLLAQDIAQIRRSGRCASSPFVDTGEELLEDQEHREVSMSAMEGGRLHTAVSYLLLRALYLFLWLQYRARVLLRLLPERRSAAPLVETVPRHIALSGAIANSNADVAALMKLVVSRGARHVTLHDPWTTVDMDKVAERLSAEGEKGSLWAVREVDEAGGVGNKVRVRDGVVEADHEADEVATGADIKVTVVRPGAGRGSLVRAVRKLAERGEGTEELSVVEVTEWLDRYAEGMLPSEPDVVVIFPSEDVKERAKVIHGFPVWQLRLTQIRFATKPIRELDHESFLQMVANAAAAPKRFGR